MVKAANIWHKNTLKRFNDGGSFKLVKICTKFGLKLDVRVLSHPLKKRFDLYVEVYITSLSEEDLLLTKRFGCLTSQTFPLKDPTFPLSGSLIDDQKDLYLPKPSRQKEAWFGFVNILNLNDLCF